MYLIDTDVLIYSLKGHSEVMDHLQRTATAPKAVSVISYGELLYGARKSARPEENFARVRRLGEVLPVIDVSPAVMEAFGSLKARLERKGAASTTLTSLLRQRLDQQRMAQAQY